MRKNALRIACLLLASAVMLTACGDEDSSSGSSASSQPNSVSDESVSWGWLFSSDSSEPVEIKPDESKPDDSKPDESKPDDSKPDESKHDDTSLDESSVNDDSQPGKIFEDSSLPDEKDLGPLIGPEVDPDDVVSEPDIVEPDFSEPDLSEPDDSKPDESKPDSPHSDSAIIGKWALTEISAKGTVISGSYEGVPIEAVVQVEFFDGERGAITEMNTGDKGTDPFVYKERGGRYYYAFVDLGEGSSRDIEYIEGEYFTLVNDKLMFIQEEENLTMSFKKVDKFITYDPDNSKPDDSKSDDSKPDESEPDDSGSGGRNDESDFIGKWEVSEMSSNGTVIKGDLAGVPIGVALQIELKKDGKGFIQQMLGTEVERTALNWTVKNGNVEIRSDDFPDDLMVMKLENGCLVTSYLSDSLDIKATLVKVDEFTVYKPAL